MQSFALPKMPEVPTDGELSLFRMAVSQARNHKFTVNGIDEFVCGDLLSKGHLFAEKRGQPVGEWVSWLMKNRLNRVFEE